MQASALSPQKKDYKIKTTSIPNRPFQWTQVALARWTSIWKSRIALPVRTSLWINLAKSLTCTLKESRSGLTMSRLVNWHRNSSITKGHPLLSVMINFLTSLIQAFFFNPSLTLPTRGHIIPTTTPICAATYLRELINISFHNSLI
jgi:hypothetical protein